MNKKLKKTYFSMLMVFCLATMFILSAIFTTNTYASSPSWAGVTTGWANVRTGATTRASVVSVYAANTHVTVYATVTGQTVWSNISTWYRISSFSSAPRYIYGGLVSRVSSGAPGVSAQGHLILVSLSKQRLYAYLNGHQVYTSLVTTGMISLQTPTGTWHVYRKVSNVTFISPWGPGSPYYYAPEHVNYVLEYDGLIYLHDATWRSVFGPGTQYPHNDPKFGLENGSHGCVNLPLNAAAWLYNWAPIGTTVQVVN